MEDLSLEEHEKNYLQMKTNQQLSRYQSDFRGLKEHFSHNQIYKSPVLDKIKREEHLTKLQQDMQEEEKQRLVAKKNQYAKYVKDFIRPQIKPKSQDRVITELKSRVKVQKFLQPAQQAYSNMIHENRRGSGPLRLPKIEPKKRDEPEFEMS